MSRWIGFVIAIIVGIGLGLFYGWVLNPVDYVDTTPDSLRQDYRADYVLMVAEAYQMERDPALAGGRLAFLGEGNPAEIVLKALEFANDVGYSQSDLARLELLLEGIQMIADSSQGETP
ncbi:MAG: hypothetical protein ISR58_08490 [Anaerolineales bacterium]|nr:hypothetical protein [Chloroflexota bacterium]MBL6981215.1 hypothetical protein [Anaerolineales bacterium]